MLRDIDADTVDFEPNYDESRREPSVLPSRFPNLLVNGSAGIAVGMATNIPPHRLCARSIDAIVAMIDDPEIDVDRLDAPRQGARTSRPAGSSSAATASATPTAPAAAGSSCAARAHVEELRGGKTAIVVTELPYGVKKGGDAGVIKKIADLVNDKVLTEIADLADHSDKSGMRIQIDLKRDAIPQVVAEQALQAHAAADDVRLQRRRARRRGAAHARRCSSCSATTSTTSARSSPAARSTSCARPRSRAHVLEGYLIALDNLDEVIDADPRRRPTPTRRATA